MENKLRRGLALLMTLIMLISCAPMDALAAIVPVSGGTQTSSGVSLKSIVKPPVATTTYVRSLLAGMMEIPSSASLIPCP